MSACSKYALFLCVAIPKKRIWRVYYAGIVVLSNRGRITCKGRSRICFYNNVTPTGFWVALILFCYNNVTPTRVWVALNAFSVIMLPLWG